MIKNSLFAILILLTPVLLSAQCGWYWQNPQPQGDDFEDVKVFKGGKVYAIDHEGDFIKTIDNGKNWTNTQVGQGDRLTDFHFTDPNNGWIASNDGKIFNNANNLSNWQKQNTPTTNNLYAIHFVNNNTGWACGQLGVILKTTDGGNTWKKQNANTSKGLINVFFLDKQTGWAISSNGLVLHTTNGGSSWSQQANFQIFTGDIQFINANKGWIVGKDVFVTNDGGDTWNSLGYSGSSSLYKMEFKNADTGWAVTDGAILHTTDGGQSWQNQINNVFGNPNQNFFNLSFLDTETGWVVGINGVIRKTTNGGKQWLSLDSGTHERLYAGDFINSDTGWVVGREGNILQTQNGGEKWIDQFQKHDKTFHGVDYIDARNGWVVGRSGTIEHTSDGGQSWQTQDYPTSNLLRAVDFTDKQNGWAVGSGGTILHTDDGGQNWSRQISPVNDILTAVYFQNTDTGWISGWNGTILYTTDGGRNWSDQITSTTESLYDLNFIGKDTGWAVGRQGTVIRTTDAGQNWNNLQTGLNPLLEGVHFIDSKRGWVAGTGNSIYYTSDGGDNWQARKVPTSNAFNDIHFTDAKNGWGIGSDGTILKSGSSPNAAFIADKDGLTVNFSKRNSSDTVITWYLGNGDTSQLANPTYTFAKAGKQTICMAIETPCGTDSICQTLELCQKTKAGYQFTKNGLTVNFQDTSNAASKWEWQFPDSFYTPKQNPSYTFDTPGSYEVCLATANDCSKDTTCQQIAVCKTTRSAFSYRVNGLSVNFQDLSFQAGQWEWYFGDGNTSSMQAPTHQFDSSGTYEVCLITKNNCSKDTFCDTINVSKSGSSATQQPKVESLRIFPHPVRNNARLHYRLNEPRDVSFILQNSQGKQVKSLSWSQEASGNHSHEITMNGLAKGVYFYQLQSGKFQQRGKLLLIGR